MKSNVPLKLRVPIRIVFYREGDEWIAHCLEFDLMGNGGSQEEAMESLKTAITLQAAFSAEHQNWSNLFTPADGRFFEMFAAGKKIANVLVGHEWEPAIIESVDAREFDDAQHQSEEAHPALA